VTAPAPVLGGAYLEPGNVVGGRYEIQREIGRGGYSVVYAATDRTVGTDVAIKLLVPPPLVAQLARERMRREVEAVRALSHPNIVAAYDLLDEGSRTCLVMELVNGVDLQVRVNERGPVTFEEAVRIGVDIAAALDTAHQRGILHRDVKPQNILLAPDHRARLTDFGSARLDGQVTVTQTGAFVGTLGYTAPEVMAGRRGDARADIYGLGMTLYFALTGALPARPSPHLPPTPAPEGHHLRAVRPDVPDWLDAIVARMTTADPGTRFPAATWVMDALGRREAALPEMAILGAGRSGDAVYDPSSWSALPLYYLAMLVLVVTVGVSTGLALHQSYYIWMSPVLAAALGLGGRHVIANRPDPVLALPFAGLAALPPAVRRQVADTLRGLSAGPARSLFIDLVRMAGLCASAGGASAPGGAWPRWAADDVPELILAAAGAATELDRLDQSLSLLERQPERSDWRALRSSDRRTESIARCETARDRMVQRLLDAISILGTARTQAAQGTDAGPRLAELTAEIEQSVAAQAAATKEITTLLGGTRVA
jgi:protein kinase-like protein